MHMQVAHDWLSENFFPFFWKFSFVAALQISLLQWKFAKFLCFPNYMKNRRNFVILSWRKIKYINLNKIRKKVKKVCAHYTIRLQKKSNDIRCESFFLPHRKLSLIVVWYVRTYVSNFWPVCNVTLKAIKLLPVIGKQFLECGNSTLHELFEDHLSLWILFYGTCTFQDFSHFQEAKWT